MSYWSHNPELLDEITAQRLPQPWKAKVMAGEIMCSDVPMGILGPAMDEAVRDYWAGQADGMRVRVKEGGN